MNHGQRPDRWTIVHTIACCEPAQKSGNKRDIAIIQVLRHTGLRVGELCNLRLEDIEMSKRKGKVIIRSGKGRQHREVPLNLDARRALQEYFAEERPEVNDSHVFIGQIKKTG